MHGNREQILDNAAALYGKSLRQLHTAIRDPQTAYDHENVSATMALFLYEVSITALYVYVSDNSPRLLCTRPTRAGSNTPVVLDASLRHEVLKGTRVFQIMGKVLFHEPKNLAQCLCSYFTLSRPKIVCYPGPSIRVGLLTDGS